MVLKKDDLINWFEEGCKPKELFRIGTEHEKFVYKIDSLKPVSYEEEYGIRKKIKKHAYLKMPCNDAKQCIIHMCHRFYFLPIWYKPMH